MAGTTWQKLLFLGAWLFFSQASFAQECTAIKPMGYERLRSFDALEGEDVKTIPIVFHIVHTGEQEPNNITDAQVLSAIPALNNDMRKVAGTPGDGIGVDTKIEFCLAVRDPDGNPSSGILRHDFSDNAEYVEHGVANSVIIPDGISEYELKAEHAWNTYEYCNVWIVNEINGNNGGGGVQGYAYLGATNDYRDGIVLLYNVIGTEGNLKIGREMNRTLTHEVGHYLSLYHTFNNTYDCDPETNCSTQGDRICDTPVTTTNYGCTPACPNAMVENYMDYSSETCKNAFTYFQACAMHDMIESEREGLLTSLGCTPVYDSDVVLLPPVYDPDVCSDSAYVDLGLQNIGALPVDGALMVLGETFPISLAPQEDVLLSFQMATDQVYTAQFVGDQYTQNNTQEIVFNAPEGQYMTFTFTTGFFASEVGWTFGNQESPNYPSGVNTYVYNFCVTECTDLILYDLSGDGMPYGGQVTGEINGVTIFDLSGEELGAYSEYVIEVCPLPSCPADLDNNGNVNSLDLLIFLTDIGCAGVCEADFNGDFAVDVNDLLIFLTSYGMDCDVSAISVDLMEELGFIPIAYYDFSGRILSEPVKGIFLCTFYDGENTITIKAFK